MIPLDELEQEIAGPEPVSDSFDMAWLQMLLSETLKKMKEGCVASETTHIWKIFDARVLRPALDGVEPPAYEDLIAEFGLKSPAQATNALATGKRMFARHLSAVIAQYETGDKAVRAEIVDVKWPNGRKQVFHDVAADKFYLIEEGRDQLGLQRFARQGLRDSSHP